MTNVHRRSEKGQIALPRHDLKCWAQYFAEVWKGDKRHEVRRNDREFEIGHTIALREYLPGQRVFTGRVVEGSITSITHPGPVGGNARLNEGVCVFTFSELSRTGDDL